MKRYIFGNWKMAQARTKAIEFVSRWSGSKENVEAAVFPSFVHLGECIRERKNGLKIGAQDCSTEMEGAFTGEVSARMLAEFGMDYVLVGHSERRARFGESNEQLKAKLHQLSLVGLKPVFCCGESLEIRKAGKVFDLLEKQLEVIGAAEMNAFKPLIIAYEPVWAIGTGVTASSSEIEEVHAWLSKKLPGAVLLYGGSVKLENSEQILRIPGVHGLLIGGASLSPENFEAICQIASRLSV